MFRKLVLALTAGLTCIFTNPTPTKAEPYVGQIMQIGFNFCPRNWTLANGQLLSISSNDALFSLYGTIYGGDGRTTFGLPDLRGRAPLHAVQGSGLSPRTLGQKSGAESVVLGVFNLPAHTHTATDSVVSALNANGSAAGSTSPAGTALAAPGTAPIYSRGGLPDTAMAANSVTTTVTTTLGNTGGSLPVNLMQPYLSTYFCVALFGIYPSRS